MSCKNYFLGKRYLHLPGVFEQSLPALYETESEFLDLIYVFYVAPVML